MILRPGIVDTDLGAILALCAAVAWSGIQMTVKVLVRTESSVTITLYAAIIATPIAFLLTYHVLTMPTWQELFWLFLVGGLGSFAHICRAQAFKEADLTAVMPMEFSKLIWVSIIGFFPIRRSPGDLDLARRYHDFFRQRLHCPPGKKAETRGKRAANADSPGMKFVLYSQLAGKRP